MGRPIDRVNTWPILSARVSHRRRAVCQHSAATLTPEQLNRFVSEQLRYSAFRHT